MIDWDSLGPAGTPTPSTPDTTAPVAPAAPGSLTVPIPTIKAPVTTGHGYEELSQEQVNTLDPGQRIGRGIDFLGEALFGRDNGSPLGGVPVLGDIVGAAGQFGHGLGDALVVKPIEATAGALSRVPLGWLPGGADDAFKQLGDWAKTNDPDLYEHWQAVSTASEGDFLGGGNLKADFNMEAAKYLDDQTHEGSLGTTPELALGREAVGSVGGALSHAITGWLGLAGNTAQRQLGAMGIFDPTKRPTFDGLNRVEESAKRLDAGEEVSDTEKQAVEAWRSGAWSMEHAQDYIVSHGQGITRNFVGQLIGSLATDPLTYATIGAGSIAKAGQVGARIAEAGGQAATTYEKMAVTIAGVQKSQMGPAFRAARGLIDPLAVYKPSTVQRAVTDLRNGVALSAMERAHGANAIKDMRAIAREFDKTDEIDSAMASYAIDQANLMIARKMQKDMLEQGLGEELVNSNVDEVIDPVVQSAGRDAVDQLTDHMYRVSKNTFTAEEDASLAGRLAATFGNDAAYWKTRTATMRQELKSALHAVTYKRAEVEFEEARAAVNAAGYSGKMPLRNMVLMTADTLDDVRATAVIENIRAVLKDKGTPDKIAAATAEWNAQAARYPAMANIGYAPGGEVQLKTLVSELEKQLKSGGITRRALDDELNDAALRPVRDMLDRHTSEGERLWNVGFRPDEEVAWGLKRDVNTGRYIVDRDPTISHVVDAVPGRQPFSDTTRNVLGQMVGRSNAERLNHPIDSMEAFANTMRDSVSGRRLVHNIERRFERSTFDAGIPKPISAEIMKRAKEVAALDTTTVRGMRPDNLWKSVHDTIPRDLRLADGSTLNVHVVMDHLLQAAEGDLRIMGLTSVLSQRMRNAIRRLGADPNNWAGQMTVTLYNRLRYAQPMFLIQRITDAPYYSILYGVTPVGRSAVKEANAELEAIVGNLGSTGMARDFSMDMPEYATRSNFTAGIKSTMQEMGLKENKLDRIRMAPDAIIANNMTNMLHARLGDIVKGSLDNLAAAAEKDPSIAAEMLAAGEELQRSFADWRRVYSQAAGRVLDDNEVGLQYLKDQMNAWRRHVVNDDGTLDFSGLIAEGERHMPADIADIATIKPDILARELGYADAASLRRDVVGHIEQVQPGEFALVKGEHDLPWLEEQLRTTLGAHPDYTRRSLAYFGETWDDFWTRLSLPIEEGGLDVSSHYAKEAQELIAIWARDRSMDPWEYLSGVMASNIGAGDLDTAMGQLMSFLKAGKTKQPIEEWTKVFRSTLDVSAQQHLLREFEAAVNVEDVIKVPTPAAFAKDAKGNAVLPTAYKPEPGYVYRLDVLDKMRGGWRKGEGVSVDVNPIYASGRPGEGIFRSKLDDTQLDAGRNAAKQPGGKDRLTKNAVRAEDIEMLDASGKWVTLGPDPMDTIMSKTFPEAVRQRLLDGVPHPDPEVEAYIEQFSKWVQDSIQPELAGRTRSDLRRLVNEAGGKTGPLGQPTPGLDDAIARVEGQTPSNGVIGSVDDAQYEKLVNTMAAKSNQKGASGTIKVVRNRQGGKGWRSVFYYGDDGKIAATMSVNVEDTTAGKAGVYSVNVRPSLQRTGVASKMYDAVQDGGHMDLYPLIGTTQGFSTAGKAFAQKWLGGRKAGDELRRLGNIPTVHASPFNRTQALAVSLLKAKIEDAQQDIFRLAEMQTKRSVLERSINHPLFGLYPASYMWGKVLPETVKFLSKNPYAATYTIANVQRSIAIQREYDREMDEKVSTVDRSAGAFLLDYMTPGLPWSTHEARMSPMVRDVFNGKDIGAIWRSELGTVSPQRWVAQVIDTMNEIPGAVDTLTQPPVSEPDWAKGLSSLTNAPATLGASPEPDEISGPTKASALAPILADDLSRLQSILLEGASPEE